MSGRAVFEVPQVNLGLGGCVAVSDQAESMVCRVCGAAPFDRQTWDDWEELPPAERICDPCWCAAYERGEVDA